MVDWCHLGQLRFTEPFFEQTVNQAIRHPAGLLFRHQTSLEVLDEITAARPGLTPAGFVFHMSRCGSTLISQMLAALPKNIVISEASPLDSILRAHLRDPEVTEVQRVRWLRSMVSALGQTRHPEEIHLFIKFDCWHTLFLPLIERAFPGVPWVFLYREPAEVLTSQTNQRGSQVIPGVLEPSIFGWKAQDVTHMSLTEYASRVLAKICEAALERVLAGSGKLLNYRQLPTAVCPKLTEYWKVKYLPGEVELMMNAAQFNAKNPVTRFENDTEKKRQAVTPEIQEASAQWIGKVFQQLEHQRLQQGFA